MCSLKQREITSTTHTKDKHMLTQHQIDAIESIKALEVEDTLDFTRSTQIEAVEIFAKFLNDSGFDIPGVIKAGSFEAHRVHINFLVNSLLVHLVVYPSQTVDIEYYDEYLPDISMEVGTLTELIIQPELLRANILNFLEMCEDELINYEDLDDEEEMED